MQALLTPYCSAQPMRTRCKQSYRETGDRGAGRRAATSSGGQGSRNFPAEVFRVSPGLQEVSSGSPRVDWWILGWIALQDGVGNVTHDVGAMSAALQADPSHSPQKSCAGKKVVPLKNTVSKLRLENPNYV